MADGRPFSAYRAACVYALTARKHPEDKAQALRWLAQALCQGCGFEYVETDTDLDALRSDLQFQQILKAVRELQKMPPPVRSRAPAEGDGATAGPPGRAV